MRRWLLIAALFACGCHSAPKKRAEPLVGWRPIAAWSGHGNAQTESFNIETGGWRIRWETKNEPDSGEFRIRVHSAVSGRPMMMAVEHRGSGHDIAYVTEDPRLYHLMIESQGDWSITIEESVVAYP